jgi:SatD family (SatD)
MARSATRGRSSTKTAIALIGDIVASRQLDPRQRTALQRRLEQLLDAMNRQYRDALAAKFLLTLGDEFQGVLTRGDVVPDIVWQLETGLRQIDVRIAIGLGTLNPPFKDVALGMDGPAFHQAREAIELSRKRRLKGGVFAGFGDDDPVLNGFARILRYVREGFTERQLDTAALLRGGIRQTEVADRLGVTRQMVNVRVKGSGWDAYAEAEHGWRRVLARYDLTSQWRKR